MLTDQQESSFLEMLIFLEADRRRILNYMLATSPSPFLFSLSFVSLSHKYADTLLITSLAPCFLEYSAVNQNNSEFLEKGMVVTLLSSINYWQSTTARSWLYLTKSMQTNSSSQTSVIKPMPCLSFNTSQ